MNPGADLGLESSAAVVEGSAPQARERWEIDEGQSHLSFTLHHLVVKKIQGEFGRWGGTLLLDPLQPSLSNLRVWIDLGSVDTDVPERDAHVRSAEFFDVAQFQLATFSSAMLAQSESPVVVKGKLDLHGAVREIELTVSPIAMPASATSDHRKIFSMRTTIDRQSFGLHWNQDLEDGGIVVGDKVEIDARVEMVRSADDA
jgi:polyisoprenoid-binding protein YceI